MDEIDWWKQFGKGFKYMGIAILVVITLAMFAYIFTPNINKLSERVFISIITIASIIIFIIMIYASIWITSKLRKIKIDINLNKEYIRELKDQYTPAIVSLIYDFKTEVYRDYTATILYLHIKKYLKISGFNNDIIITKGSNENLSNLLKHELYVYNCIIYKQSLEEKKMKNLIIEDAIEKQLIEIKQEKNNTNLIKNILKILIALIGIIDIMIKGNIIRILINLVFVVFILKIIDEYFNILNKYIDGLGSFYKLTKKGQKYLKKIKAFKNFIKEYTLIKEKDIEYIQILEEYVPYSLSLGTSPQVEEYIKQNEVYRNLIYKGREDWIWKNFISHLKV